MVDRLGGVLRSVRALVLPLLFVACGSSSGDDDDSSDGSAGVAANGGGGASGTGGATAGGIGIPSIGGNCFATAACCADWNVTISDGPTCSTTFIPCGLGCHPVGYCITDISQAESLCREYIDCQHHFDCIAHEEEAGEMLQCEAARGICRDTLPPTTERPYDLGSQCMLTDDGTFFTDPDAIETYVVRSPGCSTGICVLDEAQTIVSPQRCTYRCVPGVTDCGLGYECRELPVQGDIGDPSSVAVCVYAGAI